VYGKNLHIQRIKAKNMRSSKVWRREGYNHAMKRIVVNHYKVKHLASFLFKTSTVMEIYKLDMREYSFILWAGRYDFFDRKDFNNTVGDIDVSFYRMVNKLMKRGLVDFVAKKTGEARKIFSLTGTGVDLYNRVAKFTNKSLRSDTE
jgi:hypothetical protein